MHIAIIGNGIAGITAARHIRKLSKHFRITVISSETPYFFSRTALMYVYMGHMKFEHTQPYENWFWKKNRIDLVQDYVGKVDTKGKKLHCASGKEIQYDKLIIASGSVPNKFGWKGQDLQRVQGLYSYQDLLAMEEATPAVKKAVIVGGGLIGIEMAEMFHTRGISVSMLVREPSYWSNVLPKGESEMVNLEIRRHHIDLRLATTLDEIKGDENGKVKSIVTGSGEEIDCQFVGLTAGVRPNIAFLEGSGIETKKGVLVNSFLQTSHPDVYAVGDCAEFSQPLIGRRPIEQVWYTGRMQGEAVAHTICGKETKYNPGPWFNSAKFFTIEYQTYGDVPAKETEGIAHFYWQHSKENKAVRLVFEKDSYRFVGLNSMGIRYRHEFFDQWLREGASVATVLEGLRVANFDPEFFRPYEQEVIEKFNREHPELQIASKPKKTFLQKLGIH